MRRIVLIQPKRDGRIFGKAPGSPYTLMRLASLVPEEIPVEIWDENVRDLPMDTVREGDLVGVTSMTVTIERAERIARRAKQQGAGVVVGGVHATLMPEHTEPLQIASWSAKAISPGNRSSAISAPRASKACSQCTVTSAGPS